MAKIFQGFVLFLLLFQEISTQEKSLKQILDTILEDNLAKYEISPNSRQKRAETEAIYMKKQTADLPICQNMKGILGK